MDTLRFAVAALAVLQFALPSQAQVPPQVIQAIKPVATKLVQKVLTPKMKVESFTLGGFKATRVDVDGDATAEKFSGNALFDLPKPLGPQKLSFKNLVLKGGLAEGTLEEALPKDFKEEHLEWSWKLTKVVLSDKGSRVEGTCTLAGLRLDVAPLVLNPQGLQGTLSPGELPLAEGAFTASLQEGEVVFTPQAIRLKGNLELTIQPPVIHGSTGAALRFEAAGITINSSALSGTAVIASSLAKNLPMLYKGHTWQLQQLAFGFERGVPLLRSPVQYQFPLNVFCRVDATTQPYWSEALPCSIEGKVPQPELPVSGRPKKPTLATRTLAVNSWEGFSGSFALPAASLHPSGLTTYRLDIEKGTFRVDQGTPAALGTNLTGRLAWGPSFNLQTTFTNAPAALADGLYATSSSLKTPALVGAYKVHSFLCSLVCDFTPSHSPEGLPGEWMGVYIPTYYLELPKELFTFNSKWERHPVPIQGKAGRFEGNGTFSGAVAANLNKLINLHIAPVRLEPFELSFMEGALLEGPVVKGQLELTAEPLLDNFKAPISFHLTQNGAEQIEINTQTPQGPMGVKTKLIGITMVMDAARLHPTTMDFTGRFDFAITGAALPSVDFDHLVLEASGGGIDGSHEDLSLDFKGSRWSNLADLPSVNLWGYPLGLVESGYGVLKDGRFYVGLGGNMDVNPLVALLYNRIFFTTLAGHDDQGTIELEKPFDFDIKVASMGSLSGNLGFQVKTADEQVSDAYFLGKGSLKVEMGESGFDMGADAGIRFGRSYNGGDSFPYFYALGHFESPGSGIQVAPDLEVYGVSGGLAQNFQPEDLSDTQQISGKPDSAIGIGVMAGVNVGTTDQFAFHGDLDFFVSQNLTTILQGKGWLFCGRDKENEDNQVTADIRFTRNPNAFDATFDANLNLYNTFRAIGRVELRFAPDQHYLHVGTKEAPITVKFMGNEGWGYITSDYQNGTATMAAGGGVYYEKGGSFGIVYGNAWVSAQGELIIEVDGEFNPRLIGGMGAEGGASFGLEFDTFWKTYHITIFSGSIGANLGFQVPGSPMLSGEVSIRYRVLGGMFSGSVSAHLDL